MNWEAIGAVGEVIGAFGVIGSLLYLAQQIRTGRNATLSATHFQVTESLNSIFFSITQDPELSRIFRIGNKDPSELPNGDLLSCWFQGSGERKANDVAIKGARLIKGEEKWSDVFIMADTPGQPDCNPVLFLNKENKLFLASVVVQANRWETSLLKYRTSIDYENAGVPIWNWQDIILLKPSDEFEKEIETKFKSNRGPEMGWSEYAPQYEKMIINAAKDPKKRETGWLTRIHPLILESGKILLPL